jgi:seryl-tRNA synthetase
MSGPKFSGFLFFFQFEVANLARVNLCAMLPRHAYLRASSSYNWKLSAKITSTVRYASSQQQVEYIIRPHLNYKHIAENAVQINENMKRRNVSGADAMVVKELYQKMTTMATELNALRGRRNEITKHTKSAKSMEEKAILIEEAKALKQTIHERETALAAIDNQLLTEALQIPNDTSKDSPIGSEDCARVTKIVGKPIDPDNHPFPIADHLTLAKKHDMIDLETAALVSGASFYYLKNYGALLEVALIQYAMHKAVENGFSPVITPDIVRTSFAYSCGFQPRNNEMSQIYDVTTPTMDADSPALCLAGTAEVPLAGMFAKKIINEQELPKQMVGFGHAFRAEAGARGADTKGLYRVHQFSKVELFAVTRPDQSEAIMEKLLKLQEDIFTELGLCFR